MPTSPLARPTPPPSLASPRRRRLRAVAFVAAVCLAASSLTGCALFGIDRKLSREGTPAIGTILEIWETGMTVNDDPVIGIQLSVQAEGLAPWVAETRALVSIIDIPQVQPGTVMCLRYDPKDLKRIVLAECLTNDERQATGEA